MRLLVQSQKAWPLEGDPRRAISPIYLGPLHHLQQVTGAGTEESPHWASHPSTHPSDGITIMHRSKDRFLLEHGLQDSLSRADIPYSSRMMNNLQWKYPSPPTIHFSLLTQPSPPPFSPTGFHPFILVPTAEILYRSIFFGVLSTFPTFWSSPVL